MPSEGEQGADVIESSPDTEMSIHGRFDFPCNKNESLYCLEEESLFPS